MCLCVANKKGRRIQGSSSRSSGPHQLARRVFAEMSLRQLLQRVRRCSSQPPPKLSGLLFLCRALSILPSKASAAPSRRSPAQIQLPQSLPCSNANPLGVGFRIVQQFGEVLAKRAIEDDIHNAVYTPRKGDRIEGKIEIVLRAIIENGVDVKVKLKQSKPTKHGAFVAEELGFDMVDAVIKALDNAGYSNQTAQKVMIQSTNSSVLVKFKQQTKYDLVYMISEDVRDAAPSSLADIKKFVGAVSVDASSVFPENHHFTTYQTDLVQSLQTAGLSVYVYTLMNEFASQPYDFFSDATAQINAYVQGAGVDGLITDFPATARRYKLNTCMNMGNNTPRFMAPAHPGDLLQIISKLGVLQSRFTIVRRPARSWSRITIRNIMKACIILHNMIVGDEKEMVTTSLDLNETLGTSIVLPPEIKNGPDPCFTNVLQRNAKLQCL